MKYSKLTGRGGSRRWQIFSADEHWCNRVIGTKFWRGKPYPVDKWPSPPPLWISKKRPQRLEDMPWSVGYFYVVSTRFRAFLERESPGCAQFLPMRIEGPGAEDIKSPYWVVNWLRLFNCLDEEASMNEDEHGRYVEVPVIDPRRIPADGLIGMLKKYEVVTLIRDDLRKKIKAAGFTGPQFFDVASIDVPESINFKKVDWVAKGKGPKPKPKETTKHRRSKGKD